MASTILIRPALPSDAAAFLASVRRSAVLHGNWVRAPDTDARYRKFLRLHDERTSWIFLVCRKDSGAIAGVVHVSNAVRGNFQSAYLGYYAFAGHERQGLMREGLAAVARHAFRKLKLHRLEANIQPTNVASIALVRACGFRKEGLSPKYLKIAGRWRDHERWAILASRQAGSQGSCTSNARS